jgi:hypothetical protein
MAEHSRIERARQRAHAAKVGFGALAALVFGVAFVGAKTHAPGHAKKKAQPLGAPSSFKRAIRSDSGSSLQSGQIAPPAQPPAASSSTS